MVDRERLKNNVQRLREERMMTKTELARKAGVSTLTLDRIEAGMPCRIDTKRKLVMALGLTISDRDQVFGPEAESGHAANSDDAVSDQTRAADARSYAPHGARE
jgi:DNA-binding XRE family transcriptional regulator